MAASPRGPERHCATETMMEALMSGLASVREPRLVRERFEETLRALLGATSVTFCEDGEGLERPHILSCELSAAPMERRPCPVAVFEARRPVDDRVRQTLSAASQVASLLLELERASGWWPLSAARGRPDGAAPLIGSSLAIRGVRDRIERVAGTDFTILIEGASGPQPHPSFIGVSDRVAFHNRHGTLARAGEDGPAMTAKLLGSDARQSRLARSF